MEKIKISSYLKVTGDSNCVIKNTYKGRKENQIISYHEGDVQVCISFLDDKTIMSRKTEDYRIEMPFAENQTLKGIYDILDMDLQMDLKVKTNHIKKENKRFEVIYQLNVNGEDIGVYEFKLEYEVVE